RCCGPDGPEMRSSAQGGEGLRELGSGTRGVIGRNAGDALRRFRSGNPPVQHTEAGRANRRPIIVQKYGGSSVADVAKLGRVADRVVAAKRAGNDVVVAVSAMGKTTDGLLALAREVATADGRKAELPRRELDMLLSTGERVTMSLLSI